MKLCAVQPTYPRTPAEADGAVAETIALLERCDESVDLILLPEYSNAPTVFPAGKCIPFAAAHTDVLIQAVIETAKRCRATVAVNYAAKIGGGGYRNTTRVFGPDGAELGDYYKQHLPVSEVRVKRMDDAYTFEARPPAIVMTGGIRLAFLTCYDAYFEEYVSRIAAEKPDILLISSHQRAERDDILETLTKFQALRCNAFALRAAPSMGADSDCGGNSMIVGPDGRILASFGQQVGLLTCEIGDPHQKYFRSNGFGGKSIRNDLFMEQGRTPWCYRNAGPRMIPGDRALSYPRLCAYRGISGVAPENSLPGFGAAVALGAPEIGLDIRFTKDGVPVLGRRWMERHTFAELKDRDFSEGRPLWSGLRIVPFEEALRSFAGVAILDCRLQSAGKDPFPPERIAYLAELIARYDAAEHIFLTGDAGVVKSAFRTAPELRRCLISREAPERAVAEAVRWKCAKIQFPAAGATAKAIGAAHARGLRCRVPGSDEPDEALRLFERGVDTVLTGRFPVLSAALRKRSAGGADV